jgi:hypothetical protein
MTENAFPQFLEQVLALFGVKLVDILRETANGVNALPARDWIRSHDGVDDRQLAAHVLWISPWLGVESGTAFVGGFDESLADKSCGQTLEKLLIRCAEVVIDIIARSPQRISPCCGKLSEAQTCIVGWEGFELDITVPPGRVVVAIVGRPGILTIEVFALDGGDGADFIVADAELVGAVEDRVDVQGGCGWSSAELAETEDEFLLELVGQVVLFAEEDDSSLADWKMVEETG